LDQITTIHGTSIFEVGRPPQSIPPDMARAIARQFVPSKTGTYFGTTPLDEG